jgi:hypothetical protein
MPAQLIPITLPLPPRLPTIEGNVDYRHFRDQLLQIDHLLLRSGLEHQFIATSVEDWLAKRQPGSKPPSAKAQARFELHCRRALRCNIARVLLGESYRPFAARLADSPVLQYFCGLGEVDRVRVPSKSVLQRYDQWCPESRVRQLVAQLLRTAHRQPETIALSEPLDLEAYFVDSCCVKANIHFPVDWVLLRDATRTLMKAVRLIRDQGLKHRMEEPEVFLRRMNRRCIEMAQARTKFESQRKRKKILRRIDRLVGIVRQHAVRYRALLDEKWEQTDWTRAQTEQVLRRMDQVLELLPKARKQARQRILQGEPMDNADKLLSLYEVDARVITRRKAEALVEFGNTLLLAENPQGLLLDWELFRETAPADARLLVRSLDRVQQIFGQAPKAAGSDRGFDSQPNQAALAEREIYNGLCPRSPKELARRNESWKFRRLQQRRAQTEARIAIFKNNFLGRPLRSKGFASRHLSVAWAVLTHNLWVLARLRQVEIKTQAEAKQLAA